MYFVLKALARTLVLPPSGPLIVAAIGLLLMWRRRRFGLPLVLIGVVALWLLCIPLVADQLVLRAERYPALDPDQPLHAQAIVIIGGGEKRVRAPEYRGPVADSVLMERLGYGAFLSRRTSIPILISGAPEEAVVMRATLERNFGVAPRWVEGHSRDTYENAQFSAKLLRGEGVNRIVLVTSSTHIWRAAHEFMGAGFDVVPAPEGIAYSADPVVFRFVPSASALSRSNAALYELIGEPARRVQEALGVRERLDKGAAAVDSAQLPAPVPTRMPMPEPVPKAASEPLKPAGHDAEDRGSDQ